MEEVYRYSTVRQGQTLLPFYDSTAVLVSNNSSPLGLGSLQYYHGLDIMLSTFHTCPLSFAQQPYKALSSPLTDVETKGQRWSYFLEVTQLINNPGLTEVQTSHQ